MPAARPAGRSGTDVVVAVLDSWVDRTHPDFEGRVLPGADCLGGTCKDGPAVPDKCDHGTHVAGTLASSSYGVAPRASILPVRVLSYDPGSGGCIGQPDDVAAGIRWAVGHGARILNLSLGPEVPGLTASSSIPAAVREAAAAGAVVVFSAGNDGSPVTDSYGGDALVVAATGRSGQLASYSQRGLGVDLAAPGGDPTNRDVCTAADCITSLYPGNRYAVAAGTSMAAPHVSGIAALLLGQDPARTRTQIRERLVSTAHPLAGAGAGLVDASAALGVPARVTVLRRVTRPQPAAGRPARRPGTTAPRRTPAARPPLVLQAPTQLLALPPLRAVPQPVPRAATPLALPPPTTLPRPLATIRATRPDAAPGDPGIPLPLALLAGSVAAAAGASCVLLLRR